ncbi:DKNYY domain-containing protein [Dysgonomonas sp. OttesenSCG-928-M03]|nr:DKNYY domain-containing protein [Dysgonomonas sp. OttesenSCG-928-M03]
MKSFGFCILCFSLLFFSCRKENRVDFDKSPHYFYSQDSTKILYDIDEDEYASLIEKGIYKDVTTDVTNFSVISKEYGKDSKYIYYTYIALKNVDYNSFYWDAKNELPKDSKHVYIPGTEDGILKIVKYADPQTYEKISSGMDCGDWYKDKNYYYCNHERVDIDLTVLSFESHYLPFDKKYVFAVDKGKLIKRAYSDSIEVINKNLLRDSERYYFKAECDSLSYAIDYEDDTAFKYYDREYHIFKIDNKIYFMGLLIASELIDVDSFENINHGYSKDKKYVYYKNNVIPDCDPITLKVMSKLYTKDKNHVYHNGQILNGFKPENFKKDDWGRFPTDSNYGESPPRKSSWRDDD